jgi:hypothetical protein
MLFDVAADPEEFFDVGAEPRYQAECERLRGALLDWALRDHNRITMSDARIAPYAGRQQLRMGIVIGYWDEAELAAERARLGLV